MMTCREEKRYQRLKGSKRKGRREETRNDATHLVRLLVHRELLLRNHVLQRNVDGFGSDERSGFEDVGGEFDGRGGGDLDFEDVGSGFDVGEEGWGREEVEFEGDEVGVHAYEEVKKGEEGG